MLYWKLICSVLCYVLCWSLYLFLALYVFACFLFAYCIEFCVCFMFLQLGRIQFSVRYYSWCTLLNLDKSLLIWRIKFHIICNKRGLILHQFADDCQVHVTTPVSSESERVGRFPQCLDDANAWMRSKTQPRRRFCGWVSDSWQTRCVSFVFSGRQSTKPGSCDRQLFEVDYIQHRKGPSKPKTTDILQLPKYMFHCRRIIQI